MTRNVKTIIMGLSIFAAVVAGVFVVYTLRKPTEVTTPSPTPRKVIPSPIPSPVVPMVNEVTPENTKCVLGFTVTAETTPGLNCQTKDLYKDVSGNTAGTYVLTSGNKLASNFELVPGETYIYAISYKNTGTEAVAGTVEDVLPTGLTYKDSSDGCTYSSSDRKVTCTVASVAVGASGQVAIRFTVDSNTTASTFANTAKVIPATGAQTTCSLTNPIKPSGSPTIGAKLDCIVKRIYKDETNNTAGQYYLNNEIVDTTTLTDGQTVVYNVLVGNTGGSAVSDTTITDVLSSNLTYVDGEAGCSYNSSNRTVTCTIGSLAANTQVSKSFRAKITTAGTAAIANTAEVFSTNGQRDTCSITVNAEGKVVQPSTPASTAPSALPQAGVFEVTAGTLGIGVFLLIAGALGLLLL